MNNTKQAIGGVNFWVIMPNTQDTDHILAKAKASGCYRQLMLKEFLLFTNLAVSSNVAIALRTPTFYVNYVPRLSLERKLTFRA
ncbi:MAG: hypothetical protein NTZ04_00275 [Chloroflexi bacterium]|nr:hypothetical protein [Chloroflexota bacterium]